MAVSHAIFSLSDASKSQGFTKKGKHNDKRKGPKRGGIRKTKTEKQKNGILLDFWQYDFSPSSDMLTSPGSA